ncbi:RING-H2 finger protein ATL66-like [Diospyros lotus]|uniref:RING-H2 finger protein ATL66-like n=1 Tax=Diospyros lotus TaxID=55363 RepID=UPI00225AB172|nr:RING-H2 finger protein ATL66-like [Diospyros lotus]
MLPSPVPSPISEPPRWNPVVLALVGFFCSIFMVFSYYRILQGHCSRFRGTNQGPRQFLRVENPNDPSLQFQSRGLDSYIMHSLPITQFKKKAAEELGQNRTDCAVCLGEFEDGEWLKHLPNCSHVFHVSCIDTWFQTHSSCPLCRSYVCNLAMDNGYSVSVYNLLETLRRENLIQDRSEHHQSLRSQILHGSSLGINPQNAS